MKKNRGTKSIGYFLAVVLLAGCGSMPSSVGSDWELAKRANSAQAYRSFLAAHPASDFEQEAQWRWALSEDSWESYRNFLEKFPENPYKEQAKERLKRKSNQALVESLKTMDVEGVQKALEWGADPNHRFEEGLTPLIFVGKDEAKRVETDGLTVDMLSRGMQIEERRAVAKMLIGAGASLDATDSSGKTALDYVLQARPSPQPIRMEMRIGDKTKTNTIEKEVDPGLVNLLRG